MLKKADNPLDRMEQILTLLGKFLLVNKAKRIVLRRDIVEDLVFGLMLLEAELAEMKKR